MYIHNAHYGTINIFYLLFLLSSSEEPMPLQMNSAQLCRASVDQFWILENLAFIGSIEKYAIPFIGLLYEYIQSTRQAAACISLLISRFSYSVIRSKMRRHLVHPYVNNPIRLMMFLSLSLSLCYKWWHHASVLCCLKYVNSVVLDAYSLYVVLLFSLSLLHFPMLIKKTSIPGAIFAQNL